MTSDDDVPFRGHERRAGYRRVSHGLFLVDRPGLGPDEEFRRDLRALLLVLPDGAVFTHVTGARMRGWRLPALPEQVPYFAAVRCDRRPRRPGLLCARLTHDAPASMIGGLPVECAEEILLRCARDLSVLDLVIMVDSALHMGDLDSQRMDELLASGRPGVTRLRKAWELSDRLAESAGETLLRLFHWAMNVQVDSQVRLYDRDGRFIGRADLLVRGTSRVHEYDGAGHRSKVQHRADLRRERGWAGTTYERCGFTLDDLLNHDVVVMHELDRLLNRPHNMARLARWRALVDESLYSARGRTRVLNRWKRRMGVVEWARTTLK